MLVEHAQDAIGLDQIVSGRMMVAGLPNIWNVDIADCCKSIMSSFFRFGLDSPGTEVFGNRVKCYGGSDVDGFLLSRVGKPIVMFIITFFAVRYMTGSVVDGILVALIPAILGSTNVSASLGYSLTAVVVVTAVVLAVTPPFIKQPIAAVAVQTIKDVLPQTPQKNMTGETKTVEVSRTSQTSQTAKK